jgi:prepilin-type N-terminal cleavage/methylation domain-containing protein
MHASHRRPTTAPNLARRGFTLTELLVVIAIIAMLVAIASVGVMRAIATAKQTRIKTELDQLDMAMKSYKEKYGSYPPADLRNISQPRAILKQHIARAFPRYDMGTGGATLELDLQAAGVDTTNHRPDQALVFWLRGFSSDPAHPFVSLENKVLSGGVPGATPIKLQPLFDLDPTRLIVFKTGPQPTSVPSYFPSGVKVQSTPSALATSPFSNWSSGGAPYVYFDSTFYQPTMPPTNVNGAPVLNTTEARSHVFNEGGAPYFPGAGVAVPYWLDANGNGRTNLDVDINAKEGWANPESFQIIACGTDGKYGNPSVLLNTAFARMYPTGTNYDISADTADDDNCTNFCDRPRIGDAKP